MFALIDCNNFYASCERVFRPKLQGQAIVVLSSNDGCVIARSNEAKALGIAMGEPFFKIRSLVKNNKVHVFSSNFSLYGDMSARVMDVLGQFASEMEIYSVDEAFLDFSHVPCTTLPSLSEKIRDTVKQWTGIPVSIGVAPTKTLCKVANYFSKKYPSFHGICIFDKAETWFPLLEHMPVGELWGIGRNYAKLMKDKGIETAADFLKLPAGWVHSQMKVMGLRMQEELKGISCLELERLHLPRKGICVSRSFGKALTTLAELTEAVSCFAARAAEKLREDKQIAQDITVFLRTNRFKENSVSTALHCRLAYPSSYTPDFIRMSVKALERLFQSNLEYKKAGILLHDLMDEKKRQGNLFESNDFDTKNSLMHTLDHIHSRWGTSILRYASEGIKPQWQPRSDLRSPSYTTHWNDLLEVT